MESFEKDQDNFNADGAQNVDMQSPNEEVSIMQVFLLSEKSVAAFKTNIHSDD